MLSTHSVSKFAVFILLKATATGLDDVGLHQVGSGSFREVGVGFDARVGDSCPRLTGFLLGCIFLSRFAVGCCQLTVNTDRYTIFVDRLATILPTAPIMFGRNQTQFLKISSPRNGHFINTQRCSLTK